jgi:hypothetical protein
MKMGGPVPVRYWLLRAVWPLTSDISMTSPWLQNPDAVFDREGFLQSFPRADRTFMLLFLDSQVTGPIAQN